MFQHVHFPTLHGSGWTVQWVGARPGEVAQPAYPIPRALRPPGMGVALKLFSTLHRGLYRTTGGRLGSKLRGGPVLLLTTTGRKTGQDRTLPLSYVEADDEVVVVASAAGAERHPAWYMNLRANPRVRVQLGAQTRTMIARTVDGLDRVCLWDRFVEAYPPVADYQERVSRQIPVIIMRPATAEDGMSAAPITL